MNERKGSLAIGSRPEEMQVGEEVTLYVGEGKSGGTEEELVGGKSDDPSLLTTKNDHTLLLSVWRLAMGLFFLIYVYLMYMIHILTLLCFLNFVIQFIDKLSYVCEKDRKRAGAAFLHLSFLKQ